MEEFDNLVLEVFQQVLVRQDPELQINAVFATILAKNVRQSRTI